MSKHTPGPWIAVGSWVEVEDDDIPDICTCDPNHMGQASLPRSDEEVVANARLIAAAPEMLEALEQFSGVMDRASDWPDTTSDMLALRNAVEYARSVISLATGIAEPSS